MGFIVPGSGPSTPTQAAYARTSDWVALPDVHASDSEIYALFGVSNSGVNYMSFNITVVGGYTVDWGDGVVENVASGVQANHNYVFTDLNVATLTSDGYRQAIIKVTAQTPGTHFSSVLFNLRHPNLTSVNNPNLFEVKIRTTSTCTAFDFHKAANVVNYNRCTSFQWYGAYGGTTLASVFSATVLERVLIPDITNGTCSFASMFLNSYKLYNISFGTVTSGAKLCTSTFQNCYNLVVAPLFNTTTVANTTSMFQDCRSLQLVPLYNLANCDTATSMFNGCVNLNNLPTFNCTFLLNASSMFANCYSLTSVPLMTFTRCVAMSSLFSNCISLKTFDSNLNTNGASADYTNCFAGCISLESISPSVTINGIATAINMFSGCIALKTMRTLSCSVATNLTTMFANCTQLRSVSGFTSIGSSVCDATNMFSGCTALESISNLNMSSNVTFPTFTLPSLKEISGVTFPFTCTITLASMGKSFFEGSYTTAEAFKGNFGLTSITALAGTAAAAECPIIVKTVTMTLGSNVMACTDTSSLTVGMTIYGTGTSTSTNRSATTTDAVNDTVNLVGHGLQNDMLIAFASAPTGLNNSKIYYVVQAAADTFKVSLTQGGAAANITGVSVPTYRVISKITAITPNVDITLDNQQHQSRTGTINFRNLAVGPFLIRNTSAITG